MEPTRSILVCEEDPAARAFLADNLAADGYHVLVAGSKAGALAKLETSQPDLVICDVNGDTLELIDAVRGADGLASHVDRDVPLIVLTARADELARVRLYERGGDDVIAKPFSYQELRARVRALLRRSDRGRRPPVMEIGALRIDTVTREVNVGTTPVDVTGTEYELLCHLAGDPRRVFTKQELLRDVWRFRAPGRTRTLDCHACRLRRKLTEPGHGRFVETVWGVGYRLAPTDPREISKSAA
jgi:DNA-binding response OmpR family regulator